MKKWTTVLLSALLLFAASGCDSEETTPTTDEQPTVDTGIHTINDFETNGEFGLIRLFGVLGRVEQNTDKAYVKTGEASAKVIVESNPYKPGAPYIEQAFNLKKAGKDYTNFSDVAALSIDVYNATGAPSRVGMQLTYEVGNGTKKYYDLQAGWNTVTMQVKREYIPQTTDAYDVTAPFVNGLKIYFERGVEDDTYYIDNLKLYKTEKSYSPIVMRLKENEICSFDSEWQVELLEPEGRSDLMAAYMRVSDITSTGSGSAVRVEAPASSSDLDSWPGIYLNKQMTALVPWSEYPDNARLCFDVYAPEESGMETVWLSMYSGQTRYFVTDELNIIPGKWVTYSFSVQEMNTQMNSLKYNVTTTTGIVLRWEEQTKGTEIVYFDNFRMEFAD